jgi:hypothetical protein
MYAHHHHNKTQSGENPFPRTHPFESACATDEEEEKKRGRINNKWVK